MSENVIFSKWISLWFRGLAIIIVILSHYAEWWAWFTPSSGNAELFRIALSRLGPYGVGIFFLFSGYGLVKSIDNGPMTFHFIRKRVLASYLPYLLVAGVIELLSGGFQDPADFVDYLYGHDYWFMVVLFLFYIGFICIWAIPANRHIHAVLFVLFAWTMSWILYQNGEQDFWYVSNPAFVLGILLSLYESSFKKILDASRTPMLVLLTVGMTAVIYTGIFSKAPVLWTTEENIRAELTAVFIWTLLIIYLASNLHRTDPLIPILGKYSLYLYLTHTYIFMRVINTLSCSFAQRFLTAAAVTVIVSLIAGFLITALAELLHILIKRILR